MSTLKIEEKYRCYNDCKYEGCPSHIMKVEIQTVSDSIHLTFDGHDYWFDPTTVSLFFKLLKELDYVSSIKQL